MYWNTFGVVITGTQTDKLPRGIIPQSFSCAWDLWYYLHVQEKSSATQGPQPTSDYVSLPEHLFR
jgi:hypothetical protein